MTTASTPSTLIQPQQIQEIHTKLLTVAALARIIPQLTDQGVCKLATPTDFVMLPSSVLLPALLSYLQELEHYFQQAGVDISSFFHKENPPQ